MALRELSAALASLSKSIQDFPVGAITLKDLKLLPERVQDVKDKLKVQKAYYLLVKAKHDNDNLPAQHESFMDTMDHIMEEISTQRMNNAALDMCLASYSITRIMTTDHTTPETQKKTKTLLEKMFFLDDMLPRMQSTLNEALEDERNMKIKRHAALSDYATFLKEQERKREAKLKEINPEISRAKKKVIAKLQKINIMKALIINMIAAAKDKIDADVLCDQVTKHRYTISIEKIIEMTHEIEPENSS